ncbi:hypothetical protein [Devosia sp.]|uniref:hypothetical protein n=1 Tax=Devosia sp. TaxID=1871048 RepID=UPI003264A2E4
MSTQTVPTNPPRQVHSIGYNLAGIAILVLLLAVGAAYLVDGLERADKVPPPNQADMHKISVTISGQELAIPASWFRYEGQMQEGFSSQIDLRMTLKSRDGATSFPIDVTLVPRSRARPSSVLLDGVYLHQFDKAVVSGVPGLVGKPLLANAGFSGETVWYDALSPNPFVAKCLAPVEKKLDGRCLRTVYLESGIAAIYSFDAKALVSWQSFDTQMQKWLAEIGAI